MVDWPGRGPKALIVDIKGGFRMAVGGEGALPGKITLGGEGGRGGKGGKWCGSGPGTDRARILVGREPFQYRGVRERGGPGHARALVARRGWKGSSSGDKEKFSPGAVGGRKGLCHRQKNRGEWGREGGPGLGCQSEYGSGCIGRCKGSRGGQHGALMRIAGASEVKVRGRGAPRTCRCEAVWRRKAPAQREVGVRPARVGQQERDR